MRWEEEDQVSVCDKENVVFSRGPKAVLLNSSRQCGMYNNH